MTPEQMRARTMDFAVAIADLVEPLLSKVSVREAVLQLKDAADSTAANYRSTSRAKSHRDFTSKLGTVLEEADEAEHWLTYLVRRGALDRNAAADLQQEAGEIVAMLSTAVATARRREAEERRDRKRQRGGRSTPRDSPRRRPPPP